MGMYKTIRISYTVDEGLDTMEIEDLRDEMQEWVDNMSGTSLENTSRYEMAEEAASQLDRVDDVCFDAIWDAIPENFESTEEELKALAFVYSIYVSKDKRKGPGRAYRLSNAINHITGALQTLRDYLEEKEEAEDILAAIDEVESQVQELEDVVFPGMFG